MATRYTPLHAAGVQIRRQQNASINTTGQASGLSGCVETMHTQQDTPLVRKFGNNKMRRQTQQDRPAACRGA
ncbi:MAG: hypothetical protein IKQ75_06090 [Bacteroidales bacterium]|nr:hypothetical protein [Bacteroidales bacterium]